MSEGALGDLVVLDLTNDIAGACCTKWFADLGARVIKVEPPEGGSRLRAQPPFKDDAPHPATGAAHLYLDGGKESVTLSLDTARGRELTTQLAGKADILVEDGAPGDMDDLGLGFQALSGVNKRLVYVSITPFGQSGPYRDFPATELTVAAFSGSLSVRAFAGQRPVNMGGNQGMYIGGRVAFVSAMGALLGRHKTSEGQHVDVSLLEAMTGNDMAATTTYSYTGISRVPLQKAGSLGRGGLGRYPCKDGYVDVLPGIGGMKKLATLIGKPELAEHELFRNHALRAEKAEEFDREFMEPFLSSHTRAEIVGAAQALGMPFSYMLTPDELLEEPHLRERGFFVDVEQPAAGHTTLPGPPMRLSETPAGIGPAPEPGNANQEVFRNLLGLAEPFGSNTED